MKKILKIGLVVLILLFCKKSFATDLRGQIIHYDGYSRTYAPVPGIRVDLWIFNGAQWIDLSYAVTGSDGMYYFVNLSPGVNFQIQVNGRFCFAQPLFISNVQLLNIPQIYI